jgi:hypothetical protein
MWGYSDGHGEKDIKVAWVPKILVESKKEKYHRIQFITCMWRQLLK